MAKFKMPSWLQPSAADGTKRKRLSLANLSSSRRSKHEDLTEPEKALPPQSRLTELVTKIAVETAKLEGFGVDAPDLPPRLQMSRQEIIWAAKELESLVRGPRESLRYAIWSYLDTLSLQIIYSYGIAQLVPLETPITLSQLERKTSLDATNLARVLRHAMTKNIFREDSPGLISHTPASRLLAQDELMKDWIGFNAEECFPAAAHVLEALRSHPEATSLTETGFNYAFGTVGMESMYATLARDPERARRMGHAMASFCSTEGYEVSYFVDGYDLADVDERGGTFVDLGGSHGFVCVELARRWPKMSFVVQDLASTLESAPKPICEDEAIASRIRLQKHDFFEEQPIKGADVYHYRWIFHNYPTPSAINLLKKLVPSLKPGSRILINDHCLLAPGSEPPLAERVIRSMDMQMLALLNAQERDEAQFRALFEAADRRFVFAGVRRFAGCRMAVVEAIWEPWAVGGRGVGV
ncbi:hypothetical protein CDD80_5296 [Ophiocordyceps camponoti-rufipedis]|uniref:O-methyltransferase domain-containing protein n=1 Tax=Ophiocordyceps camponoti-rufipedis TaxID=2004952 RepID=A0A2C5YUW2_9HYPO|nr:hypothetical protein CDD80_5296 [Ophiocordyceps camponoti-rufipedis]